MKAGEIGDQAVGARFIDRRGSGAEWRCGGVQITSITLSLVNTRMVVVLMVSKLDERREDRGLDTLGGYMYALL